MTMTEAPPAKTPSAIPICQNFAFYGNGIRVAVPCAAELGERFWAVAPCRQT